MNSVYFARFGDYVKIGFSSHPRRRIEEVAKPNSRLIYPDDFDFGTPGELVLVIPFCRMRDERNLHLLFGQHWSGAGEWFRWSPAFRYQMETMQFVTHDARLKYLRRARRDLGVGGAAAKEANWGKRATEHLAARAAS